MHQGGGEYVILRMAAYGEGGRGLDKTYACKNKYLIMASKLGWNPQCFAKYR